MKGSFPKRSKWQEKNNPVPGLFHLCTAGKRKRRMSSLLLCPAARAGEKLGYKKRAGVTEAAARARGKSLLEKVAEDSENLPSVRGGRFLPPHQGRVRCPPWEAGKEVNSEGGGMTGASGTSGEKPCPCAIAPMRVEKRWPLSFPRGKASLAVAQCGRKRGAWAEGKQDEGAYRLRWAQSVFLLLFLLSGTRAQGQAARTAACPPEL